VRSALEVLLAALVAVVPLTGAAQERVAGEAPTRTEVEEALAEVAKDPNLAAERTVSMLKRKAPEPAADEPWWWQWANAFVHWLRGLFGFFAESGRLVVWVLGAIGLALLALFIARLIRERGLPRVPKRFVAPSHVRDLDIRPESLPDDVGAAALALWERGEQRAALALLYRATLSRLVHVHEVPIRASSTEGECVALAKQRVRANTASYAARLVGTWTAAVYGGETPATGVVQALCADFAAALDGKGAV
jgi:hypothetical protein